MLTCCSFQNGAEVPKGTGPGIYTVTDPPKGTGPGVYTVTDPLKGTGPGVYVVTDPFGTETVPKTGPAFLEVQFSDLIGNGLTVRLDRNHLEPVPCEHSQTRLFFFPGAHL